MILLIIISITYDKSISSNVVFTLSASPKALAPSSPKPFQDRLIFCNAVLFWKNKHRRQISTISGKAITNGYNLPDSVHDVISRTYDKRTKQETVRNHIQAGTHTHNPASSIQRSNSAMTHNINHDILMNVGISQLAYNWYRP